MLLNQLRTMKIVVGVLLLIALSSCLIGGEAKLLVTDKIVTTNTTTASIGVPVIAQMEIRGIWLYSALSAYAIAEGRMELCIVRPPDDPIKYCLEAPTGHVPPGVELLPGETLGADAYLRLDRSNMRGVATYSHSVAFTSTVPQELILMTRYISVDGGSWTIDVERRQANVTFQLND